VSIINRGGTQSHKTTRVDVPKYVLDYLRHKPKPKSRGILDCRRWQSNLRAPKGAGLSSVSPGSPGLFDVQSRPATSFVFTGSKAVTVVDLSGKLLR
jgi:hypothetical protein